MMCTNISWFCNLLLCLDNHHGNTFHSDSYSDTALVMRGGPSPSVQSQAQSQLGMTQLEQREAEAEELQDLERCVCVHVCINVCATQFSLCPL